MELFALLCLWCFAFGAELVLDKLRGLGGQLLVFCYDEGLDGCEGWLCEYYCVVCAVGLCALRSRVSTGLLTAVNVAALCQGLDMILWL